MKDIRWNKILLEEFLSIATLTDMEEKILRSKLAGYTISQQADIFNMSISSINRALKSIDEKYDDAEQYSLILPARKKRNKSDII
jgi:DNA-binding CsgD family transcriptional regulator